MHIPPESEWKSIVHKTKNWDMFTLLSITWLVMLYIQTQKFDACVHMHTYAH